MFRLPGQGSRQHTGLSTLDQEIAGEIAAALGHAGRRAEKWVAALLAFEGDEAERLALRKKAVDAVYAYFVQRELAGMRNHDEVIRSLRIPREVLARLGQS